VFEIAIQHLVVITHHSALSGCGFGEGLGVQCGFDGVDFGFVCGGCFAEGGQDFGEFGERSKSRESLGVVVFADKVHVMGFTRVAGGWESIYE
jgi:hypothetical protein